MNPAALSVADRKHLRALHRAMQGAVSINTLVRPLLAYLYDKEIAASAAARIAAETILDAHKRRIDGESSPVECDQAVARVIG